MQQILFQCLRITIHQPLIIQFAFGSFQIYLGIRDKINLCLNHSHCNICWNLCSFKVISIKTDDFWKINKQTKGFQNQAFWGSKFSFPCAYLNNFHHSSNFLSICSAYLSVTQVYAIHFNNHL